MATKPDYNSRSTSSDTDEMPSSLGERQARSYRPDGTVWRGTKLAIGNSDGSDVGASLEDTMSGILYELRALRLGMILAGTAENVDELDSL